MNLFISFFLEFSWEINQNFCEFLSNNLISRWKCMVVYCIKRLNKEKKRNMGKKII
jgi:hypothetical protein